LLQQALAQAQQVVVVLGSAFQARSPKNPFTWQERAQQIQQCLNEADALRVRYAPVRDYYDQAHWVQAVMAAVRPHTPEGERIALIGHFKDDSSQYLAHFPGWEFLSLPRQGNFDATPIRDIFWNLGEHPQPWVWQQLCPLLPAPVVRWLQAWQTHTAYPTMRAEWSMIQGYRAAWSSAPYPPVFVTVDALLLCNQHVLLIERGHAPGKGLWALPGGFVEPSDTLWQSCLRELYEETHLPLTHHEMHNALLGTTVFDHPNRSLRGRTITHVFTFSLTCTELPTVRGGDDASRAQWFAVSDLAKLEEQMFEDHFHVLRNCFARFGHGPTPPLA